MFKVFDILIDYLKSTGHWSWIRHFVVLAYLYTLLVFLGYQYIRWRYDFPISPDLYIGSYVVKQITLVFAGLVIVTYIFAQQSKKSAGNREDAHGTGLFRRAKAAGPQFILAGVIVAIIAMTFVQISPREMRNVRIKLFKAPGSDFDKDALTYLIYEVNRRQQVWYFEIDFKIFNESIELSKDQRARCNVEEPDDKTFCHARMFGKDYPLIGLTTEDLVDAFFWKNLGTVSLISTFGWKKYEPPSVYEFLIHAILVQSIIIHLNAYCGGLPGGAFTPQQVSYGGLFQIIPSRGGVKATILAAHLSPKGMDRLLNCFGAEYTSVTAELLRLEWMAGRVEKNLSRSFGVQL